MTLLAASACDSARPVVTNELPQCERCHGGSGSAAPPMSAHGATDTTDRGVGAHRRHLEGTDLRAALSCDTCHDVPTSVAHVDGRAPVRFNDPITAGGAAARWNADTGRCENAYCHNPTTIRQESRGTATAPDWTRVDGTQMTCGSCHAAPPPSHAGYAGASADARSCHGCHGETVRADGTIDVAAGRHMDGVLQTPAGGACGSCHPAPPQSGAHLAHANWPDPTALSYGTLAIDVGTSPSGAPAYLFGCGYCHPLDAAEHQNGAVNVVLTPAGSGLKLLNASSAAFDTASARCSGVYCHGSTLRTGSQGSATAPVWTAPSGTQNTCASCHARPPSSHAVYQNPTQCQTCHSATVNADGSIDVAGRQHINGSTPVPTACNGCHAAPPGTGAHRTHANPATLANVAYGSLAIDVGTSPSGAPAYVYGCGYCHPLDAASHQNGTVNVDVAPSGSGLKLRNAANAAFDPGASTCSGVYCHGATLRAGTQGAITSPNWTILDGTQRTCASCHAQPPASHATYPGNTICQACHTQTVNPDGTINVPARTHVDGTVQAPSGTGCNGCHGAPPNSGAHRVHANPANPSSIAYGGLTILADASPTGGTSYDFGCGFCHPTDLARHQDGTIDLVLAPPATADAHRIKARNAVSAAYSAPATALTGTCSGVYCHSSGQETPAFVTSPAWNATPGALGCAGCHANPPKYPSGGPGAADANSHVDLDIEIDYTGTLGTTSPVPYWEFGHFAGWPGAVHPSKHGGGDTATWGTGSVASPITCQACHYDTVDPAKVRGTSGFFYFDPDGDYDLRDDRPGVGLPTRGDYRSWQYSQCATCHASELGSGGRVLPLRHVNGARDVAFDRRRTLPRNYAVGISLTDSDPDTTIWMRPYYVAPATPTTAGFAPSPDAVVRAAGSNYVITATLESAAYDATTKTCSNVACHLGRQAEVTAGRQPPLQWGEPYVYPTFTTNGACASCHPR